MFCAIYRSNKRDQTYLYIEKRDDFSRVPDSLLKSFGTPVFSLLLPLDGSKKPVNASLDKVKQTLADQGYYLQLPPPAENLLTQRMTANRQK